MTRKESFVIVGGNLTAGAAATTLRQEGFDGRIVVVGEEPHPPYERPPLSKTYLRGEADRDSTLLHPVSWYPENDVELVLGVRATGIDCRSTCQAAAPSVSGPCATRSKAWSSVGSAMTSRR